MAKNKSYSVWGVVKGSRYLGTFDADSEEEALKLAEQSDRYEVFLCKNCSKKISKPEVDELFAKEIEIDEGDL